MRAEQKNSLSCCWILFLSLLVLVLIVVDQSSYLNVEAFSFTKTRSKSSYSSQCLDYRPFSNNCNPSRSFNNQLLCEQQQQRQRHHCWILSSTSKSSAQQENDEEEDYDYDIIQSTSYNSIPTTVRKSRNNPETIRRNLELNWKLMSSIEECDLEEGIHSCGGMCEECDGEGLVECRFCGGTGFFMIGDDLIRMPSTTVSTVGGSSGSSRSSISFQQQQQQQRNKPCPVCSGDGEEECKGCMGRQYVAKWRQFDPKHLVIGTTHNEESKDENDDNEYP